MHTLFSAKPFRIAAFVLALLALGAAYSFLPLTSPQRSASPDENANVFFSKRFAETGTLWYFDPMNIQADGAVHPRSTRVADSFIVPGGFIGLPVIYGSAAAGFGVGVLPYLTPFFAVLGVLAWGVLIARFFGMKVGIAAGFLLAFNPVWWYETARTMQPNILFVSLLTFSLLAFFGRPFHSRFHGKTRFELSDYVDAALAGIFLAFALSVRASEAYWLALAGLTLAVCFRTSMPWKRVLVAGAVTALALAPFVVMNASTYGSPFSTGYGAAGDAPVTDLPQGHGAALIGPLQPYLFPLGFAPRAALEHFASFGLGITWWWTVLVGCAFVALAAEYARMRKTGERMSPSIRAFFATSLVISAWLVLFYGSWTIRDNPDPNAVTIGSSYLRYWLPIFMLSTVPVAWLFVRASRVLHGKALVAATALFFAMYGISGATDVFYAPQEGLLATRDSLFEADEKAGKIFAATPKEAVIVVDRADKYLFPERRVIVPLRSEYTYATLGKLRAVAPLYYFGISFPERDLAWLRETKLPPLGLSIEPVLTVGEETLYRFVPVALPVVETEKQ